MTEITIAHNDAGQRADRFLTKAYPNLTLPLICKLMRKKRIKLNGAKVEPNTKLSEGDVFRFYLSDELLEKGGAKEQDFRSVPDDISIIYEDENILLIDKPVGMVVHEDNDNTSDTLINRIKCYLWKKGEYSPENEQSFAPALCNRIDRNTGGIVIAAKNAESLRILNQKIHDRELTKLYLCVVAGIPEKREATLTAYLHKIEAENRVIVSDKKTPENRTIKTKYHVLESHSVASNSVACPSAASTSSASLVEVDLLTGRTHQIRAHFAHIGHPLLGDGKYGCNKLNKALGYPTQALYSYKLAFRFTTDGGCLSYLDGKEFEVKDRNSIWFVKKFREM